VSAAIPFAIAGAALSGFGIVAARMGVRYISPRAGAAMSVPIATATFWLLAPIFLHTAGGDVRAIGLFAAIGAFFPAAVTILSFESARRLGSSVASALSTTTALFSAALAVAFLGERPGTGVIAGTLAIVGGVACISWHDGASVEIRRAWHLLLPLSAAAIRAVAQTSMKHALALWANPYAATLIGYSGSATLLVATRPAVPADARSSRRQALPWFAMAGLCNGGSVLTSYAALGGSDVTFVVPILTTAPLFALGASLFWLRDERASVRLFIGVGLTVLGAVVILVARSS